MQLTHAQKQQIRHAGYVQVPGVVPRVMVDRALRAINASVGQGMNVADMTRYNHQSFCPDVAHSPVVADLFNRTPAQPLVESVLGEGRLRPVKGGQVALRFPSHADPPPPPRHHLDGTYSPTNGVTQGTISNFTALLAVFLSDVPGEFCGNFTVWPGSHLKHAEYFTQHTPQSLLNGLPPVDVGSPVQITASAGDIVIAHYLLAHAAAANTSPHVRYAIFFRLDSTDLQTQKWESMTDPWLHWPGMNGSGQ